LRSFNTYLDAGGRVRWRWRVLCVSMLVSGCILGLGFVLSEGLCRVALAADGQRVMRQYLRQRWGREQGLAGAPVRTMAQTPDGYLWIGTDNALLRFDGQSFRVTQPPDMSMGQIDHVIALTVDAKGAMWVRMLGSRILRYRDGRFEMVLPTLRNEPGFTAISRANGDGVIISALSRGTLTTTGDHEVRIGPRATPLIISNAQTTDGRVWLGTREGGLLYLSGQNLVPVLEGVPDRKVNCLLAAKDGRLWIGTDNGLALWDGKEISKTPMPGMLVHAKVLALLEDRNGSLWVGTPDGLIRYDAQGAFWLPRKNEEANAAVSALLEDAEGNIWLGDSRGIEQLRAGLFTTFSSEEGLPGDHYGAIYAGADERIWFGPLQGGLYWLHNGEAHAETSAGLNSDVVYSIGGAKEDVWVGRQRGGLTHLHAENGGFTSKTYTRAQGLAQNSVYSVHQNRDGSVWAGTLTAGVSHFVDGKFTNYTTTDGLASNSISAIEEGADGTMWFATPNGLSAFTKGKWRNYATEEGLPSPDVICLLTDAEGVLWVGTAEGLAYLSGGVLHAQPPGDNLLHEPILGLAQSRSGSIWITTDRSVLKVKRQVLLSGHVAEDEIIRFAIADGLGGTEGVRRDRSMLSDSEGRIWLTTNNGLSMTNPWTANGNPVPAIAHVESAVVDGKVIDLEDTLHVSSARQRIAFNYTGLSFDVADRVRFRYRLDPFDTGWSDPVQTRQAIYTNLRPGKYRFRVMASNGGGQWNGAEGSMQVTVDPQFWQTWQFQLACVAVLVLIAVWLYHMRMQQIVKQVNVRFEERFAERTRIAQELHDTLLQGFFSASLQLHVAMDRVPGNSAARPMLARVLQVMDEVIEEARDAVRGLRAPSSPVLSLEQIFATMPEDIPGADKVRYQVVVAGTIRPLSSIVDAEVCRIGREALTNAFRHAEAHEIEVGIEYSARHLRIQICDDGRGIDPQVLLAGREGHWGLRGMRERAERIGAKLQLGSRNGAGTEMILIVPGHIAYKDRPRRAVWSRLGRWLLLRSKMQSQAESKAKVETEEEVKASRDSYS
jgi:ligand-binding sensor domain-containing protein/signal transduction histidine kinase